MVVLYALLFMALITAIAIFVSVVIINEIRITRTAVEATLAYYAAESGVEKGLYKVKVSRDSGDLLSDVVDVIKAFEDDSNFDNDAGYTNEQTNTASSKIENQVIKENDYIQADYYNVDAPLGATNIELIGIHNGGDNPDSWAEVSWIAWDTDGKLGTPDPTSSTRVIGPTDLQSDDPVGLGVLGQPVSLTGSYIGLPAAAAGYRLRVKALHGDLSDVTVTPYEDNTLPPPEPDYVESYDLPSQVVVRSVGTRGKYKQSLEAVVPWKIPLYGLYDYVLYSEEPIAKTTILSSPVYSSGVIQIEADNESASCINCAVAGTCYDQDWLANACTGDRVSCTIDLSPAAASFCTLRDNIGQDEFFTLPIPEMIPKAEEYYLSLRYRPDDGSSGTLEILIDDPQEGQLGLTFDYTGDVSSDWDICTLAESFSLSAELDRNITYTNQDNNDNIDLDWYQISTNKIYKDCPQLACTIECSSAADCSDADICTQDICSNAGECSAACSNPPNACNSGDTCCPAGCSWPTDTDCPPSTPPTRQYLRYAVYDESGNSLASLPPSGDPGKSMRDIPAWEIKYNGEAIELKGIWAADANNIWAVGNGGAILYSDDGGDNWTPQTSNTTVMLRGIWGTDANNIWAVGNEKTILYTDDGGATDWQPINYEAGDINYNGIYGTTNPTDVWVVGGDGQSPNYSIIEHYEISEGWKNVYLDDSVNPRDLFGVWAVDANNVWVVGRDGAILFSDDIGGTWVEQDSNTNFVLYSISGITKDDIWTVGANTIRYTRDGGGTTWETPAYFLSGNIYSVAAYSEYGETRALLGATSGRAAYFNGSVWSENLTGSGANIRGIYALDMDNIWTAGGVQEIHKVNLPGSMIRVGKDPSDALFDQYWLSKEFTNITLPDNTNGDYIAHLYMTEKTLAGGKHVYYFVEAGYCDNSGGGNTCDQPGEFITMARSDVYTVKGVDPGWLEGGIPLDMPSWGTSQLCNSLAPCRLWFRLTITSDSSAYDNHFILSVSSTENFHSYLEIPPP